MSKYIKTEKYKLKSLEKIRKLLITTDQTLNHIPFKKQTANDWLSDLHKGNKTNSVKVEAYISYLRTLSCLNYKNSRKYNVLYFNVGYNDLRRSSRDICDIYNVKYTPAARSIISRIKRKLIALA